LTADGSRSDGQGESIWTGLTHGSGLSQQSGEFGSISESTADVSGGTGDHLVDPQRATPNVDCSENTSAPGGASRGNGELDSDELEGNLNKSALSLPGISPGAGGCDVNASAGDDNAGLADGSPTDLAKSLTDNWSYMWGKNGKASDILEGKLSPGEETPPSGALKRRAGRGRKVTSRSSSFMLMCSEDMEEENDESLAASAAAESAVSSKSTGSAKASDCPLIPKVISSAKDIPKEVIDTLRYSSDETKRELYTQRLLEAIGCSMQSESAENSESSSADGKSIPRSRRSSACIILKDFLQTIVPHDAAHNVLVGDIDYMIVDDEGVRYFESASGFASRRSSRYDIRQTQRSRSSSTDQAPEVWPWADVGPSQAGKLRRISIDEFRKRMITSDVDPPPLVPLPRSASGDRVSQRRPGRHSTSSVPISRSSSSVPISRSSSGYVTPISGMGAVHRSRRGSIDDQMFFSTPPMVPMSMKRQRKVATASNIFGPSEVRSMRF